MFGIYSGHSGPEASNALYRKNLAKGQDRLSIAFDLPTQTGYDPDHPLIEDLKRKDFVAFAKFTEKQACENDFMKTLAASYRTMAPFTAYLTRAVGATW